MTIIKLLETKTFWGGVASIGTGAAIGYFGHDWKTGAILIGQGVLAITGRHALVKQEEKASW